MDTDVIDQTLELFVELTTFGNGKMLLSLEAVNYILTHHTVGTGCGLVGSRAISLHMWCRAFQRVRGILGRR